MMSCGFSQEESQVRAKVLGSLGPAICVFSRPYGIRQLVHWGKRPVLCRDLTDVFLRDPRGLRWGIDHVVAHIERRWCPTITSDELVGGEPFRFAVDKRDVAPFARTA